MTSDDQRFLDVLTEYSKDIRDFTGAIWDTSDRQFAHVAGYVKKHVPQSWLPERARPLPPSPAPHLNVSYVHRVQDWISRNRALTVAILAFLSTGGFLLWREKKWHNRKRRARKASNGARTEVVGRRKRVVKLGQAWLIPLTVIAGSPNSPITRSLTLDFERRGFIVYVVCSNMDEEQQVLSESRADVRPLHLDVVDSLVTQDAIEEFQSMLARPHIPVAGASPHNLSLQGVILIPDLIYPTGPIETVSPERWSDALNAKVLNTIAITQALLPTIAESKSRVLMLTPSIITSLRPPFHSVETTIISALEGFLVTLRAELGTLGIDVVQFHLGTFDLSSFGPKNQLQTKSSGSINPAVWPTTTRALYANNFVNQVRVAHDHGLLSHNGSSLRELHNTVFDALKQRRPRRVWRVGRGSVMYDVVGTWVPSGLVGWMMGLRRVSLDTISTPQLEDSVQSWEKIELV